VVFKLVKKEENKYLSIVINKREKHLTNMGKLNNCLKKLMKKRKKNKTNAWGRESCPGT